MSMFDPNVFLDAQQTAANEARATIPTTNPDSPDGLYTAIIGEVKTTSGEKDGKPWVAMVVPVKLQLGPQVQALGLPNEFQLTDRVFLDLTADGAGLDNSKGKNNGQRFYREALKMNTPGEPFSWRAAQGRMLKVQVKHDMYEGRVIEKVGSVVPA